MYIKSPINYTGNKYRLLKQIIPLFPNKIDTFYDLCAGSTTVSVNVNASKFVLNDLNSPVIEILRAFYSTPLDAIIAQIEGFIYKQRG